MSVVIKKMVETRYSSAIPTGDVRPGMGLLAPAPKYLVVTLLLAGLLVNAVMVLVVFAARRSRTRLQSELGGSI